MNTIVALFVLTVFVAIAGAAIYWWSECQYARNQLDQYQYHESTTKPTQEEIMSVNLNNLAKTLAVQEGGNVNLTIAQIKDTIAALGQHWRDCDPEVAAAEFAAIVERAGKKSAP
jgi:hypothetical protein